MGNELMTGKQDPSKNPDQNQSSQPTDFSSTLPSTVPGESTAKEPSFLRIAFAADISNAYFRHGYMQQDRGLVIQPTLSLSLQPIQQKDWTIAPYFIWFNSIHTEESPGYAGGHGNHTRVEQEYQEYLDGPHDGAPFPHYHTRLVDVISFDDAGGGWFETEFKPGVAITNGPLILDLNLMGSVFPTNFHDTMIELGFRVSYDLASIWQDEEQSAFSLRFDNYISIELKDDNGDEETVIETSLSPAYRFQFDKYRTQVSMPIGTGWSLDGYYQDTDTNDETFGYVSLGLKATIELPTDPKYGRWFINAGATWYRLLADSAIFANGGDEDGFAASIGFGVAF